MPSRWLTSFLWFWAIWSVGASIEYLAGIPTGVPGLLLGIVVAVAIATGHVTSWLRLRIAPGPAPGRRESAKP